MQNNAERLSVSTLPADKAKLIGDVLRQRIFEHGDIGDTSLLQECLDCVDGAATVVSIHKYQSMDPIQNDFEVLWLLIDDTLDYLEEDPSNILAMDNRFMATFAPATRRSAYGALLKIRANIEKALGWEPA